MHRLPGDGVAKLKQAASCPLDHALLGAVSRRDVGIGITGQIEATLDGRPNERLDPDDRHLRTPDDARAWRMTGQASSSGRSGTTISSAGTITTLPSLDTAIDSPSALC